MKKETVQDIGITVAIVVFNAALAIGMMELIWAYHFGF